MNSAELIKKFDPANAAELTEADINDMRNLTDDQIDILAKTYPNQPMIRPYLLLYDDTVKPDKQLYIRSTWQNLRNLRKLNNKKNFRPWNFTSRQPQTRTRSQNTGIPIPQRKVVDLSPAQAAQMLEDATNQSAYTTTSITSQNTVKQRKVAQGNSESV